MRQLWLHIGSHKTGTSSLQRALLYAQTHNLLGDLTYAHCPKSSSINQLIRVKGAGKALKTTVDFRGLKAAFPDKGSYIASSEMFFWIHNPRQVRKLARVLKRQFDKIHIVAYLRRQDSLAISHRKQAVMRNAAEGFYGLQVSALPTYQQHFDRYFQYDQKLKIWADAFGNDNLHIRKFEKSALFNQDTVDDFFHLLGLATPEWGEHANPPLSRKQLLVGLYQRSKGVERPKVARLIKKIEDPDKLIPSRAQAEVFLSHFKDSNRRLAEILGDKEAPFYFDMDLSRYPEVGNDTVTDAEIEQWITAHSDPQTP
ncbi:hypothetical protein ALP8811_02628 [Aliiroseovarius pelagivivens]|uniref:Sulfotransferase domain-containing protein n=1 Tax=Aliiroseovarius pelagivivens TaxID=1639690 RepID=A0A2R8ARJ4_9RHOB|nr:hypothetical protein [Aliiroseovarius pelagivivens]SPF78698.1 hypothetical protein ALP8811_02628 [Aliiroseovarius pelagivivens]